MTPSRQRFCSVPEAVPPTRKMFLALSQAILLVTSQSANPRKVLGAIGLGSQLLLAEKMFVDLSSGAETLSGTRKMFLDLRARLEVLAARKMLLELFPSWRPRAGRGTNLDLNTAVVHARSRECANSGSTSNGTLVAVIALRLGRTVWVSRSQENEKHDQDALLALVECHRFWDTRSRLQLDHWRDNELDRPRCTDVENAAMDPFPVESVLRPALGLDLPVSVALQRIRLRPRLRLLAQTPRMPYK